MRISDWSSDVCSSDLLGARFFLVAARTADGGVKLPLVQRLLERLGLHHIGVHSGTVADRANALGQADRKSVVEGKSVSVRVDLGGRRIITQKNKHIKYKHTYHSLTNTHIKFPI